VRGTMRNVCVIIVLGAVAAASAGVTPQIGDRLYFSGWQSGQPGGSVTANATAGSSFDPFKTFCVEIEENIYVNGGPGYQYKIANIGTITQNGGKTMTAETAWLYNSFRTNALAGYNDASVADRNVLQYAIWHSLGYTDAVLLAKFGGVVQTAINSYANKSWSNSFASSGWTGLGNVRIANLVWGNSHSGHNEGYRAQDQLIIIPAPGAALLGALGVGLTAWIKRRMA
jgi:hypothetical protein